MDTLTGLNDYICVNKEDLESCVDVVEHQLEISGKRVSLRLHHLKFDGNGMPMVKPLAELLYQFIIDFCIASRNRRGDLNTRQMAKLVKEARELFRHPDIAPDSPDKTGEAGEALLFLLIEAVLKAPQVVAKMELKTNRRDEVKGSDGIHMRWNDVAQVVDVYFGESKLYQNVGDALTSAFNSIDEFHEKRGYKHEFSMVTKHFKYADSKVQEEITKFIQLGEPSPNVRINHACLIGYDWKEFDNLISLPLESLNSSFKEKFRQDSSRLLELIDKRFDKFENKHLFLEVFFIPFPSVSDFRNAFNAALD